MRKFNEKIECIEFCNGGSVRLDGISYNFVNTCSIDYFLVIVYLVTSKRIEYRAGLQNSTSDLYKTFLEISDRLKINDWNEARLCWYRFNNNSSFSSNGTITVDFFLTIEEAFFNKMKNFLKIRL